MSLRQLQLLLLPLLLLLGSAGYLTLMQRLA
jgi:hypothetical protein